jgi:hypothetical protein
VAGVLTMLLTANMGCNALEKITIEIKHDGNDLSVEVKGIEDAMAAWDPNACLPHATHERRAKPRVAR